MQMQSLTLSELVKSVVRRPWWLLVPLVVCLAAAFGVFRTMTPIYRASTLVMVEKQKVPSDYVKATVTTDIDERLKTIEQQITNRDNLERIISEMNLYPKIRREQPIDKVVEQMRRRDLAVERRGDVFRIYFKDRNPVRSAAVANRIAELFISQNLKLREDQAQGTSSFLETELAETKGKLEQQEARIAAFKRVYMGELPEQRDANMQAVGQLQTKLEINMDAVDKAETRKIFLQAQVAELQKPAAASSLPALPTGPAAPSRLDQLRTQLAELTSRYTDRHPDVIRTREEIARLEQLESTAVQESDAPAMPPPAKAPQVSPALRAELEAVDQEIRGLQAERERILADIASYQARVEAVPGVEQQLLSLSRDYDNIKKSYESLLAKRIDARLAENLEKSRQGEQFTILEKAVPPPDPFAPSPPIVLGGGLLVGALLGLGMALLRDQTDATIGADAESLQEAFPGVPVLATIPIFSSKETAGLRASASRFGRA